MLCNFACIFYILYTDGLDLNVRRILLYSYVSLGLVSNKLLFLLLLLIIIIVVVLIFLFFSDFFCDYLSKNAIDLENSFFFFYSKWIVLIEMKCS